MPEEANQHDQAEQGRGPGSGVVLGAPVPGWYLDERAASAAACGSGTGSLLRKMGLIARARRVGEWGQSRMA